MTGTDSYHRNDDGSYGSSSGQSVTNTNGNLYVSGAPTGYRDIGFGVQPIPLWERFPASSSGVPAASQPQAYQPPSQPMAGGGFATGHAPVETAPFTLRDGLVPLMLPVYVWQLIVAALVYAAVSSPGGSSLGAHLHPAWGVSAAIAAVGAYLWLARFWPTALVLALASSGIGYLLAWQITQSTSARQATVLLEGFDWHRLGSSEAWERLGGILAPGVSAWTLGAVGVCVLAHLAYWSHRR